MIGLNFLTPKKNSQFRVSSFKINQLDQDEMPFTFDKIAPLENDFPTDQDGIILYNNQYYHPGQIADEGLFLVDTYRQINNQEFLLRAEKYAHKLLELSLKSNGALYFPYPFDFPLHGLKDDVMRAPWYSGMTQGEALSLFSRLYGITHKKEYLMAADQTFQSFVNFNHNPWIVNVDDNNYYWIDEYPEENPDQTLNGFIFGTFGLYDYYLLKKDSSSRKMLMAAFTTIKHYLPAFRNPGKISFYCLKHKVQNAPYHKIHIRQLNQLYKITGDSFFKTMADNFYQDYHEST